MAGRKSRSTKKKKRKKKKAEGDPQVIQMQQREEKEEMKMQQQEQREEMKMETEKMQMMQQQEQREQKKDEEPSELEELERSIDHVSIHVVEEEDAPSDRYEHASHPSSSSLLDEVLPIVLSKLPLLHLLRLRSVCKSWKDLISPPLFASFCSFSPPSNYLLAYHDEQLQFFDPESNSWHTLSPPFPLPSSAHILPDPELLLGSSPSNVRISPSAEGLLCLELNLSGRWVIRVWNVLTDAWRDLPPLPDCNRVFITHTLHTYLSPDRKTFFLWKLVSWSAATDDQVLMYDSSKDTWAPVRSAEGLDWSFLYRNRGRSILVMRLKCMAICLSDSSLLKKVSLKDCVPWECGRMWSEFPLKILPSFENASLVHCGGRALITSWLTNDGNRTLEIWEFDRLEMKWKLIDCMPRDAVEALNTDYVQCLAGNNNLFFIGGDPVVALIYDMSEKQPVWRWVPEQRWLSTATSNSFHIGIFPASLNACNL